MYTVDANNWLLCELALQSECYATLVAFTRLLDKHCAFHCVSKRAVDSVLLPGSGTFPDSHNLSLSLSLFLP